MDSVEKNRISKKKSSNNRAKKVFMFILKATLAVGIIVWMIHNNYDAFIKQLEKFNFIWLIPAIICYFIHILAGSWRWHILTKVIGINVPWKDAFFMNYKALFWTLIIPGGAIGGDLAKIGILSSHTPKGCKVEGAFTILMDRITGMFGLFSTALVVTAIAYPTLTKLPDGIMKIAIFAVILSSISGLAAGIAIFCHRQLEKIKPIGYLMKQADHYSHGTLSRMTAATDLYRNAWKTLIIAVLVSIIFIHLNLVLAVYFITQGLGITTLTPLMLTAAVIVGNIAGLIPLSIAGIGIRDSFIKAVLNGSNVSDGSATAIPILYSAMIIMCNMVGGLFVIFHAGQPIDSKLLTKGSRTSDH
ncbi:MAG: flippase-like domain-containing protein [Victivallaceae bacterium]|nr:flippase-like domain-containing protein [Victivallaceae bacterium]